ncbi:CMGC/CLK protein kinase [Pseudohyphozyma bogoriensis]|nr:CMGC/CLK protein kinase [Pseudohyphozyma bogoriensis]
MSKVAASRPSTSTTTTTARRAYPSARAAAASTSGTYTSRRGAPTDYRIDEVIRDGVKTEVLTIEDTPPPVAGPSGSGTSGSASTSMSGRYESYSTTEPALKKRKSDGAHISDQPYASSSYGQHQSYQQMAANTFPKPGTTSSKNKRKLDDGYGNGAGYTETQAQVAVKVIRAVPKYREASKVELKVLSLIRNRDGQNKYKCIRMIDTFDWKDHVCIVTELLSSSVFDFLKENGYQPFPFAHIQEFALQLFTSVSFLHAQNLVHTDLKPENILLESIDAYEGKTKKALKSTAIRLIDFGSATFENEYHATVVSTRHYRAPEIILGTGWSFPCDIWSIGCILIEFYTGEALFQTHENVEHLAMMERVFGPMPQDYIKRAMTNGSHREWFKQAGKGGSHKGSYVLDFPNSQTTKQSQKFVRAMKTLDDTIKAPDYAMVRFKDLLSKLLQWDPKDRLTPDQALKHPFFQMKVDPPAPLR